MGSNLDTVARIHAVAVAEDGAMLRDAETREALAVLLEEVADPALECTMVAGGGFHADYTGTAGLIEAWEDWLEPFEDVRIELEETAEPAPDCVLDLIRMSGRSMRGGAEVATAGGAAWIFEKGRLVRVEFHLDREQLRKTAGLEPSA